MDVSINCSLALKHLPEEERPAAARDLGYDHVEYWWPFDEQAPSKTDVDRFVDPIRRAGVQVVQLNFPGGGERVGDRGLLSVPGREDDFLRAAEVTAEIGRRLGVTLFNPMAGNAAEWGPGGPAFETAVRNLARVAPLIREASGELVVEPLSGFAHAAVKRYGEAAELCRAARDAGAGNVGILFDLYHAAVNEDPVLDELSSGSFDASLVSNVQIADAPGRGWPGTGSQPLAERVRALQAAGYRGRFGFECTGSPRRAADAVADLSGPLRVG